jgi:type II secretory pathway component GspD/PulD (secretin)
MTEESTNDEETFKLDSLPLMNMSISYFPTVGTIQVVGGSESQLEMIREFIAASDVKTPQAYLEIQIVTLSEEGSKTFDNNWQLLSKNFSFNAGGGSRGFVSNSTYPIFFAGRGYGLRGNWVKAEWEKNEKTGMYMLKPGTNMYETVGQVAKWGTSPQLTYAVRYLIENSKARVLANPKVLLTSGQPSSIDLTRDYVSKVTTQYLDSGSASGSAQVQKDYEIKEDDGIKVTITPFISPDGYVTLDIKPEYKTINQQILDANGDPFVTLLQRRDLDLKGIRIKDGETLVIGGMIQESEHKAVTKIPFLGDIPVLGMFFRSTTTDKMKEEMVIMLTPQIVVDTEDAVADDTLL